MKSLLETATRNKVRDILSVEVREERELTESESHPDILRCDAWRRSWWR